MSVNDEFERMWNETVELHFEALPWYLSGRADYKQAIPQEKKLHKDSKNPDRHSLLEAPRYWTAAANLHNLRNAGK
jgi:hypothetical protein